MKDQQPRRLTRREFLKISGLFGAKFAADVTGVTAVLTGAATLLSSCNGIEDGTETEPGATSIPGGIGTLVPTEAQTVQPPISTDTQVIPTPTIEPTSVPSPEPTPTLPPESYPRDSSNFLPLVGDRYKDLELSDALRLQSENTRLQLIDLGLEEDVNAVKRLYIEEQVRATGNSESQVSSNLDWEYYLNEGKSWLVISKDKQTGRYTMPVITDATCGGTGRKIDPSMATILGRPECQGDFFDLEDLEPAGGLGNTRQVIFKDRSGWFVFGEASDVTKEGYVWYDMKKERDESWTAFNTFRPENASDVARRDVQDPETGETERVWMAINGRPGVEYQFDPKIREWKLDTLKLLIESGVEFPKNFETHLEQEYGDFNFRLSQELFGKFNLPAAHLQEDVAQSFYLHAMGRYMFAARWVDEERYADFFELADKYFKKQADFFSGKPEGQGFQYDGGWPEFQELAKKRLSEDDRIPLDFGPEENNIDGEIQYVANLNMNFMTKEEYLKAKNKLKETGIKLFKSTNSYLEEQLLTPDPDSETALFINGDNIEIIGYNRGISWVPDLKPGADSKRWGSQPLEKLSPGFGANWYYNSLVLLYKDSLGLTLRNLSTDEKARKFGNDKVYFEESEITHYLPPNGCGTYSADNFELFKKYKPVCAQIVENTFSLNR